MLPPTPPLERGSFALAARACCWPIALSLDESVPTKRAGRVGCQLTLAKPRDQEQGRISGPAHLDTPPPPTATSSLAPRGTGGEGVGERRMVTVWHPVSLTHSRAAARGNSPIVSPTRRPIKPSTYKSSGGENVSPRRACSRSLKSRGYFPGVTVARGRTSPNLSARRDTTAALLPAPAYSCRSRWWIAGAFLTSSLGRGCHRSG